MRGKKRKRVSHRKSAKPRRAKVSKTPNGSNRSRPNSRPNNSRPNSRPRQFSIVPRRKTGLWFRMVTMAAIIVVVLCCITLFFQVGEIHVQGNQIYSEEQIAEASGISMGDNLVSIRKPNAASMIMSSLPFVERVHIERTLPDTVTITVTESEVTFAIRAENEAYYLINTQGKVLKEIKTADAADYPTLEGLVIAEPTIGAAIYVAEEQQKNMDAALELMSQLEDYGIAGAVSRIDVTKLYSIMAYYGSQYEIMLGGNDNLAYKVEYLASVLDKLGDDKSGVIDLTFEEEKKARFQPY